MRIINGKYKVLKDNNAITLIALIITIVVLLILAGISVQAITNTGLFEKTRQAAQESKYASAAEKVALAVNASYDSIGKMNDDYLKENVNKIDGLNKKVDTVTYDYQTIQKILMQEQMLEYQIAGIHKM